MGLFVEPTIFLDVRNDMKIPARLRSLVQYWQLFLFLTRMRRLGSLMTRIRGSPLACGHAIFSAPIGWFNTSRLALFG